MFEKEAAQVLARHFHHLRQSGDAVAGCLSKIIPIRFRDSIQATVHVVASLGFTVIRSRIREMWAGSFRRFEATRNGIG